jgi:hypothetical protein
MQSLLDTYYMKQPEPTQGCLLALKDIILNLDPNITQRRKFQIPFFYYKDLQLCYIWVEKKKPLIGFIEDKNSYPKKDGIKRKDTFERLYLDPNADIPIKKIISTLKKTIKLYNTL